MEIDASLHILQQRQHQMKTPHDCFTCRRNSRICISAYTPGLFTHLEAVSASKSLEAVGCMLLAAVVVGT